MQKNVFHLKKSWRSAESNHGLLRRENLQSKRSPSELAGHTDQPIEYLTFFQGAFPKIKKNIPGYHGGT